MEYLRYGGGGGSKGGLTMGCKYRQRTGACCCDNPPIGCMEPEERRAAAARMAAAPVAAGSTPPANDQKSKLPTEFPMHRRDLQVPAFGWRRTAADAACAVAAGVRLLDAGGDAKTEAALRAVDSVRDDILIATALPPATELTNGAAAVEAAESAAFRIGRPCSQLLLYVHVAVGDNIEAAADSWVSVCDALSGRVRALGLACCNAQDATMLLRLLQSMPARTSGSSPCLPDALLVSTTVHSPQRALLGLCRRLSVLPMALAPSLPCAEPSRHPQPGPIRTLAWSSARGVPSFVCAEDAVAAGMDIDALLTAITSPLAPLSIEERDEFNRMGS